MNILDYETLRLARVANVEVSVAPTETHKEAWHNCSLDMWSFSAMDGTVICYLPVPAKNDNLPGLEGGEFKYSFRVPLADCELKCVYTSLFSHLALLEPYGKLLWVQDKV